MMDGEVMCMIVYADIMGLLAERGYTRYRLRQEKLLGESTIERIRAGGQLNTGTLDVICRLLQCQPGELLSWVPDKERE